MHAVLVISAASLDTINIVVIFIYKIIMLGVNEADLIAIITFFFSDILLINMHGVIDYLIKIGINLIVIEYESCYIVFLIKCYC